MATMKYSLVTKKNRDTGEVRIYANSVNEVYDFDDLQRDVVSATTVTEADVQAVLAAVLVALKREILKGNDVKLGSLGAIYPTFRSEGTDDAEKFTSALIQKVNLRFRPSTEFTKEVQKATFTIAPTKKLYREAIKSMKDAASDAVTPEPGPEP